MIGRGFGSEVGALDVLALIIVGLVTLSVGIAIGLAL